MKTGVLLVNLGTPLSPNPGDVYRYLIEFLTDSRVMDLPWLKRQLLVRGIIVPFRYRSSARAYRQIWTKEGSPLLIYGRKVQHALQHALGHSYVVELAMRYQEPSIKNGIANLMNAGIDHLIVLPLFPQYASATTGSVHQRVQEILSTYTVIPKLTLINQFATDPGMINAFSEIAKKHSPEKFDHMIFSFHGLPESHIRKADCSRTCFNTSTCCETLSQKNYSCYSAQCYATAHAIANRLQIPKNKFTVCFQSRLGKDPWLQPYTSAVIDQLAKQGKKSVLVMSPAFVCDCLETLFEINIEYSHNFRNNGGEKLVMVEGLNDHPLWISALHSLITEQ